MLCSRCSSRAQEACNKCNIESKINLKSYSSTFFGFTRALIFPPPVMCLSLGMHCRDMSWGMGTPFKRFSPALSTFPDEVALFSFSSTSFFYWQYLLFLPGFYSNRRVHLFWVYFVRFPWSDFSALWRFCAGETRLWSPASLFSPASALNLSPRLRLAQTSSPFWAKPFPVTRRPLTYLHGAKEDLNLSVVTYSNMVRNPPIRMHITTLL